MICRINAPPGGPIAPLRPARRSLRTYAEVQSDDQCDLTVPSSKSSRASGDFPAVGRMICHGPPAPCSESEQGSEFCIDLRPEVVIQFSKFPDHQVFQDCCNLVKSDHRIDFETAFQETCM